MTPPPLSAADEVAGLCSDLIRIDSANPTSTERVAAEWTAGLLADAGLDPFVVESAPGRASVLARWPGADPSRPALVIHGHLDVVPAEPADWQVHPFSGEVRDGCVWGRGAVDMKDMDAMTLAVVRDRLRTGRPPARDVVLAFFADEEAGGRQGSHWIVDTHPDWFEGVTEGIGEVGGFSVSVTPTRRLYLVESAQKGMLWMHLVARGRAGHGSMLHDDNAVTTLAEAVARLGRHEFPVRLTPTMRQLLAELSDAFGVELDLADAEQTVARLGAISRMLGATPRNTANPTMLRAGYKVNVIPQSATATVDGRFLPGYEEEFLAELDAVLGPDIERVVDHHDIALEVPFEGDLVDAMTSALLAEDPDARVVPYMLSGGTDAKAFSRLGITCYGFAPLRLPPDLDFTAMFHGVDERVPVDALQFGTRVLDRFLDRC